MTGFCSRAVAATPSASSEILKASNSAPMAGGFIFSPGWDHIQRVARLRHARRRGTFLLPANGFLVLNFYRSKYTDHLVVLSHRHFLFGSSYDWYWLYDPSGKKELGPLGHFNNREDLIRQAHGEWLRGQALALILCPGEWLHRCDVGQFELDPLLALPAIERKAAGGVHLPAAAVA